MHLIGWFLLLEIVVIGAVIYRYHSGKKRKIDFLQKELDSFFDRVKGEKK